MASHQWSGWCLGFSKSIVVIVKVIGHSTEIVDNCCGWVF